MYNVYIISSEFNEKKFYKIGFTKRPVDIRIKELKTGNASDLEIVNIFKSKWGTKIESLLHRDFKKYRLNGEWFDLNEDLVNRFTDICSKYHNNFELLETYNTYVIEKGGI
jgi:hypothetical protein